MTSTDMAMPPESPSGRLVMPLIGLSLGALFVLTRHEGSPPLLTALAGVLGLGYLPGLAVSLWVERRFGLWASWILPLILSPVVVTAIALILAWVGLGLPPAIPWIVLGSAAATALAPQPGRELEDWTSSLEVPGPIRLRSDRQQVILLASVVLVLIALPLLTQGWLRDAGQAGYHIALSLETDRRLPPFDPFAAGITTRTPWAFHVYLSLLRDVSRVESGYALVGGNLIAAFTLVFACYMLLTSLGLGHARALWGVVFVFFGLGGSYLLVDLGRFGSLHHAWEGAAVLPVQGGRTGFDGVRRFFLEPFLTSGPLVPALVYGTLFTTATVATLGGRRLHWDVLVFLSALGLVLFHPGVGAVFFLALLLAVPTTWLVAGLNPVRGAGGQLGRTLLPVLLAVGLAYPYWSGLAGDVGAALPGWVEIASGKSVLLLLGVLPLLILAAVVWLRCLEAPEPRKQAWVVYSFLFTIVVQGIGFGGGSLDTPIVLLGLMLALSAGAAVPVLWGRTPGPVKPLLALAILVLLVPRTALGVKAYLAADDPRDRSPALLEAADWLREHTAPGSVVAAAGPDLALAADRSTFIAYPDRLQAAGYPDLTPRLGAFVALLTREYLEPRHRKLLLDLDQPLYIVRPVEEPGSETPGPLEETRQVFANDAVRIYRWEPAPDDEADRGP